MKILLFFFVSLLSHLALSLEPMVEEMCRDERTYQSCYSATKEECLTRVEAAVQKCLGKIPPRPAQPEIQNEAATAKLNEWNALLKRCTGMAYEDTHRDLFLHTQECEELRSKQEAQRAYPLMGAKIRRPSQLSFSQSASMAILPLALGIAASVFFLRRRAQKAPVKFGHGFLAWLIFIFGAFLGEIASHVLFPQLYKGIGDNPTQMAGTLVTITYSPFLNFIIWVYYRYKSRNLSNGTTKTTIEN